MTAPARGPLAGPIRRGQDKKGTRRAEARRVVSAERLGDQNVSLAANWRLRSVVPHSAQAGFGSIEPGKRAALITVRVPEAVDDVEEYLVSGIEPDAIDWLE